MAVVFTPKMIAAIRAGALPRYLSDAVIPGLQLRVGAQSTGGARSWSVRYRIDGQQRRLTLGSSDVLTLADARSRAKDELKKVSAGDDPAGTKQSRRAADTVADFADVYIEKHAKPKKRSWRADEGLLKNKVLPVWKNKLMIDITRRDVRELLDGVAETAPVVANRTRSLLHKMFNLAIRFDVVDVNPVTGTERPGVETSRDRVLSPDEIRAFWAATDTLDAPMRAAFRLRLITGQRGGEVFSMRWQDLDLVSGWWVIPATGSKNKMAHRVPLASMALDILQSLKSDSAKPGDFVLAGARGKRQQAEAAATFAIPDFHGHDLRRTAATMMGSAGVSEHVIAKLLNHKDRGVTKVYVRSTYDAEKRIALDQWARQLASIIENVSDDQNVLPFTARA